MALFVTLEGGEGAGKSALVKALAQPLAREAQRAGAEALRTFEPGATPLGAALRERLFDSDAPLAPWTEALLFLADRADHVQRIIRPALEQGAIIICDRYTDSTLAYQGGGRGLDLVLLRELNHAATDGLTPDLTLLLDLPPAEGLQRARNARPQETQRARRARAVHARHGEARPQETEGAQPHAPQEDDRIGREALEFHERVRRAFLRIAEEEPARVHVLDATRPPSEVFDAAWALLEPRLPGSR